VAVALLLVAFKLALTAPVLVGANCTTTVHDFPGPRLVALQPSLVTENADEPDSATFNAELADPPVFSSVKVCEAVWLTVTCPKSFEDGDHASTGWRPASATAGISNATAATATAQTTRPRAPTNNTPNLRAPPTTIPAHPFSVVGEPHGQPQ
jgi:hypothetical protein